MDSKLRRMTILTSVSVLFLVTILVVYSNKGEQTNSVVNSQQSSQNTEAVEEVVEYSTGQIGNNLKAFLSDDTFFDEEESAVLSEAKRKKYSLSMIMTSVEKDIRIQVVNAYGDLVTDEELFVSVEGQGDYKDLDRDGMIYIAGLASGEYYVTLNPVEGYTVPERASRIQVKDKVEYLAINDISFLIKTEDEVDPKVEDTQQNQASKDSDVLEVNNIKNVENAKAGIDVSKWNGEIDWDKVKEQGVEFAIIRAGYRGSKSGSLIEDPLYEQNIKGATGAGIETGIYFFSQAIDEVEAVEEASAVLKLIEGKSISLPIFIDSESAGGDGRADGIDEDRRTRICEAFCRTIENAGYKAGVYASRNWFNNMLTVSKLDKYTIWLAEYRKIPLYQGYYNFWQYSSKGKIEGIEGNVDLNIMYE